MELELKFERQFWYMQQTKWLKLSGLILILWLKLMFTYQTNLTSKYPYNIVIHLIPKEYKDFFLIIFYTFFINFRLNITIDQLCFVIISLLVH